MRPVLACALTVLVGCSSTGTVLDAATDQPAPLTDAPADVGVDVVATDRGGPVPCTAGRIEACPCTGGAPGAQTCGADGVHGPCVCLASDAGPVDVADVVAVDAASTDAASTDAAPDAAPLPGIAGDEYCRALAAGVACTAPAVNTCGVCVTPSSALLTRTRCDDTQRRESCDTAAVTAPAVGCFAPGSRPVAGTSEPVTLWGYVSVFGNGGDSQHVRVSVHRVAADGTPGELVGRAVSDVAGPAAGSEDVYSPSRDRVLFTRRTGGYQIPNVPTETELVVVTEGDPADTASAMLWSHPVYTYDVVLLNAAINAAPAPTGVTGARTVRYVPRVLSNSDWTALPATATFAAGITAGRAMVLGEVHDCDDVRLANATVESAPVRRWDGPVVYFSENDTNPLPDLSRSSRGTSLLGTFMLLDLDPGLVRVAAVGRTSSASPVHLGSRRVRAFANAVTFVTLRGLRPWQVASP